VWYCQADLINNIFWGNTANYSTSHQIQGNTANVIYCCVEGGFDGEGNIEDNPHFTGDSYILSDGSPCIDAGNPALAYYDPEDPAMPGHALYPAQGTLLADMGVYGGPGCGLLSDVITGISPTIEPEQEMAVSLFPNPANEYITIEVRTNHRKPLEIQICDTNEVIRKLSSLDLNSNGVGMIRADISDLNPGLYLVTIRSEIKVTTYRFIKI
jgi:hypothetical protein